jgi:hypothetical protein
VTTDDAPNCESGADEDEKYPGREEFGVTVSRPDERDGSVIFVVGWKENDPNDPKAWSMTKKWTTIITTCILTAVLIIPTSVDGPVQAAFNERFGVDALAGSMTTGEP